MTSSSEQLKVLVVEDDLPTQSLLCRVVSRNGFESFAAGGGDEAMKLMRRHEFAAVILDLLLPGANGFEVLRFMKNVMPSLMARTIVVTAASEALVRDCDDLLLVCAFLRKPLDVVAFGEDLKRCADGVARRRGPAAVPRPLTFPRRQTG